MAAPLPQETYNTLWRRILTSRGRKSITMAPNTTATLVGSEIWVTLHGNLIARLRPDGLMWLSDAGWPTQTTARRLRALVPAGHCVYIQNGHTYVKRADGPAIRLDDGATICY